MAEEAVVRFKPHRAQRAILDSKARFKVVAAGRRFGKTYLALMTAIIEGLRETNDRGFKMYENSEVVYFGVTLEQARRNAWNLLKLLARPVTAVDAHGRPKAHENTCVLTLVNGVRIRLMGFDDPDQARGMSIRFAILDEYATHPPDVWREIVRPALADNQGGAIFIGTPKWDNHFFDIFMSAKQKPTEVLPNGTEVQPWTDWEAWEFETDDNPLIPEEEKLALAVEYAHASADLYQQEIKAKFLKRSGALFKDEQIIVDPNEPEDGAWYVAVDPAGFRLEKDRGARVIKKRDEFAMALVKVSDRGWWVKDIITGQWTAREAAHRIIVASTRTVPALKCGIEKGALAAAMDWYLDEYQRQLNAFVNIVPVTHGNINKYDRVQFALQGRFEKKQIKFAPGPYLEKFRRQAMAFPSVYTHDDMVDALAYIDQIAVAFSGNEEAWATMDNQFEPLDEEAGY